MTAKPKARSKCKHPELDKTLRCKSCRELVDIREKKNKYGNKRTDGFDSAREAKRFQVLRAMGIEPECQVTFDLTVEGVHICDYRADFVWQKPHSDGPKTVEDVKPRGKGFKKTAAYRLFVIKKRLMLACHGIEVVEV